MGEAAVVADAASDVGAEPGGGFGVVLGREAAELFPEALGFLVVGGVGAVGVEGAGDGAVVGGPVFAYGAGVCGGLHGVFILRGVLAQYCYSIGGAYTLL